jgi:hypothetical protein
MDKKITLLLILVFYFSGQIVLAAPFIQGTPPSIPQGGCDTQGCELKNPLGTDNTDPRVIIGQGIRTILGIVGSVALAVFIYGGILWLTSGGNEQRIKKGKDVILWATLGLVVIFAAYAIVGFFLGGGFLGIFFAV